MKYFEKFLENEQIKKWVNVETLKSSEGRRHLIPLFLGILIIFVPILIFLLFSISIPELWVSLFGFKINSVSNSLFVFYGVIFGLDTALSAAGSIPFLGDLKESTDDLIERFSGFLLYLIIVFKFISSILTPVVSFSSIILGAGLIGKSVKKLIYHYSDIVWPSKFIFIASIGIIYPFIFSVALIVGDLTIDGLIENEKKVFSELFSDHSSEVNEEESWYQKVIPNFIKKIPKFDIDQMIRATVSITALLLIKLIVFPALFLYLTIKMLPIAFKTSNKSLENFINKLNPVRWRRKNKELKVDNKSND